MASTQPKTGEQAAAVQEQLPGELLAVNNPVVVAGDGSRVPLSGNLTREQFDKLGEAKVRSLWKTGHLQSPDQLEEADRLRGELAHRRATSHINPDFGTPSMTPEAMAKYSEDPGLEARTAGANAGPTGRQPRTPAGGRPRPEAMQLPVTELGLDAQTVESLQAANLQTVEDVLRYGAENDGSLQGLDGIGERKEQNIRSAIEKVTGGEE